MSFGSALSTDARRHAALKRTIRFSKRAMLHKHQDDVEDRIKTFKIIVEAFTKSLNRSYKTFLIQFEGL